MSIDERYDRVQRFKDRVGSAIEQALEEDDLLEEEVIGALFRMTVDQCASDEEHEDEEEL